MKKLSKRLEAVSDLIRPCGELWDIGCDHGLVCINAVKEGRAVKAVAVDVAEGPLESAKANIKNEGLGEKIKCVLSDGLKSPELTGNPGCMVISGMGGRLIADILLEGSKRDGAFEGLGQLILGPQSDLGFLRRFLINSLQMDIVREVCVYDDGKYYFLFDITPKGHGETYSEADYMLGKHIAGETLKAYASYLGFTREKLMDALKSVRLSREQTERSRELTYKLKLIEERTGSIHDG